MTSEHVEKLTLDRCLNIIIADLLLQVNSIYFAHEFNNILKKEKAETLLKLIIEYYGK